MDDIRKYLDLIFDSASKVLDHEGGLHHCGAHKERVVLVMLLEFVQQSTICGLREAGDTRGKSKRLEWKLRHRI